LAVLKGTYARLHLHRGLDVTQARIEVFTSDRVFAFRDQFLTAWNLFMEGFDADGDPDGSSTTAQKQVIEERALAVRELYDDLCIAIRKELRARSLVGRR
jgi:hypothetical protein